MEIFNEIITVCNKHKHKINNALGLFLDIVYNVTEDKDVLELQKILFEFDREEKLKELAKQLNQARMYQDVETRLLIQSAIETLQNQTYNEEHKKMVAMIKDSETLVNMIDRYNLLVARRQVYGEFEMQVPEQLQTEIHNLKRDILSLVQIEKDKHSQELEFQLRELETLEEKRARLQKELEELKTPKS